MADPFFLKWPGAKSRQAADIASILPDQINRYWEPCCGTCAVFRHLVQIGRIQPNQGMLSDRMQSLTDLLSIVREHPEAVDGVSRWPFDETSYYRIRDSEMDRVGEALKLLYVSRRGFNGLIRTGPNGLNTPWGGGLQPWPEAVSDSARQWAQASRGASIQARSVFEIAPGPGDVVYVDPPFLPTSKTASFNEYSGEFGIEKQRRLEIAAQRWARAGAFVLISNSDTETTRQIYGRHPMKRIEARRSIGAGTGGASKVSELLILVQ